MSARRVTAVGIALVCSLVAAGAQEALPVEKIPNWTAPPFWTPPGAKVLESWKAQGLLPEGAEAVEGLPSAALPFFAIAPCRIVDTRPASAFPGAYGPPIMAANASRDFDLNSAAHCPGIPVNAEAYSINVTVTETTGLGDVRIWPAGAPPAVLVSTQNWPTANLSLANAAIAPAGAGGAITVYVAGSATHLIIDINGYYAPIAIVNTVNALSGAVMLAAGTNVSITPSGNTLTIASTAPAAWLLSGNADTSPGPSFIGTTNDVDLELRVNDQRAFLIQPQPTSPNLIGGFSGNIVTPGMLGGTISGGGAMIPGPNQVTSYYATVGGGVNNRAGWGSNNLIDGSGATVAGGGNNWARVANSTISGGLGNFAEGYASTIPGGQENTTSGAYSFAAGYHANADHGGTFVWADYTPFTDVASTAVNQFIVRASGGIWLGTTSSPNLDIATDFINTSTGGHLTIGGVWTDNSDRDSKENFQEIDEREILSRVAALPITRWSYKAEGCAIEHLGPMAQDFSAAFGLGSDDRSISSLDSSGVALAAIQALYDEVQGLRKRLAALEGARN